MLQHKILISTILFILHLFVVLNRSLWYGAHGGPVVLNRSLWYGVHGGPVVFNWSLWYGVHGGLCGMGSMVDLLF